MPVRLEYFMATTPDSPYYGAARRPDEMLGAGDALQTEELPAGWLMQNWGVWQGWTPRDWRPRLQGWKIHVSASMECAVETLARATRVCVARNVAFKFLPHEGMLSDTNGKQADRGSSGKFITIYPGDDAEFAELLVELEEALAGQEGPYILSDLRYGDAPVYVRYGGIMALNYPDSRDEPVSAIVTGEAMMLTKDDRSPRFVIPEGVDLPECLQESYDRSRQSIPTRLREFKALAALHFSNAGGVYKGTLPDGTRRVLREARPHTGLDARGRDAITRQRDEERVLRDLIDVEGVQRIINAFDAWEHRYLELEYIDGRTLTSWMVLNSAYDTRDGGDRKGAYEARCRAVGQQIIDIVERVHARGWSIGDLHPGNIMVTDDDQVVMLDLEDASRLEEARTVGFRVFEFCAPEEFNAAEADWYAVSRALMLLYQADWELEVIAPAFWQECMRRTAADFGPESVQQIESVLARFPHLDHHLLSPRKTVSLWPERPDPEHAIAALDAGITWSRQFSRHDSYPGDPTPGSDVAESFGYGRAGVVWAGWRTGRPVEYGDLDALEKAAADWHKDGPPGLYEGLAGMALALAESGRTEAAATAARAALSSAHSRQRLDLYGGVAGVVLAAIEVARIAEDESLLADALGTLDRLHRAIQGPGSSREALTHRRGLHFGLTGVALADIAAHLATGDVRLLDRAIDRLREEVESCFVTSTGEMMVRDVDANRALPYIEWGSAGVWAIVQVAERLARQRLLDADQREAFARACSADFYVYPGLDHGRAGCAVVLASSGDAESVMEADRQVDLVLDTLLEHDGMAVHAGDGFLRLSSDLHTGAAGTAVALHCVVRRRPFDWLPVTRATAETLNGLDVPTLERPWTDADELTREVTHG